MATEPVTISNNTTKKRILVIYDEHGAPYDERELEPGAATTVDMSGGVTFTLKTEAA